jgi:Holliday junction resolvase RusA-like endonuclease
MAKARGISEISMSNDPITIYVPGKPQPGGSKRGFLNRKSGKVIVTDANPKAKPWQAVVALAASEVVTEVLDIPLRVRFDFVFTRPKGHYRTGKNAGILKPDAPPYPTGRPDAGKLARSAEDALTGIVWRDDAQIVTEGLTKRYGDQAGVTIRIAPEIP